MIADQNLSSIELYQVEKLVGWNTKIKLIEATVGHEQAGACAKKLYKKRGLRAPNGMPGYAVSEHQTTAVNQCYIALASTFSQLRAGGSEPADSMMAVFELYMKLGSAPRRLCNVNTWFSLARDMDAGNAGLYKCDTCGGAHLWQRGSVRIYRTCIWCAAKIRMPRVALDETSTRQSRAATLLRNLEASQRNAVNDYRQAGLLENTNLLATG